MALARQALPTTLDAGMQEYEKALDKLNHHVVRECKVEIEEFERAKRAVESKLREVQSHASVVDMEEDVRRIQGRVDKDMRAMAREVNKMYDDIEDDLTLDDAAREAKMQALSSATREEYVRLGKKFPNAFPAAVRAQALSQMRGLIT